MTRSAQPRATVYQPGSRYVLRFEVSGEVLATFREALAKVRRDAGGSLDDDSALLLLARHVLAGPVDDGRASYQVELTMCEHCQRATQTAQGESLEVATEVAAMARCDGQRIASANSENAHVGFSRDENAADKTTTDRKRRRSPREAGRAALCAAPGATTRPASLSGARLQARKFRGRSSCLGGNWQGRENSDGRHPSWRKQPPSVIV